MEKSILEEVLAKMGPMTNGERESKEKRDDEGFMDLDDLSIAVFHEYT